MSKQCLAWLAPARGKKKWAAAAGGALPLVRARDGTAWGLSPAWLACGHPSPMPPAFTPSQSIGHQPARAGETPSLRRGERRMQEFEL